MTGGCGAKGVHTDFESSDVDSEEEFTDDETVRAEADLQAGGQGHAEVLPEDLPSEEP